METTLINENGETTAYGLRVIRAIRIGFKAANLLPVEDQSFVLRGLSRSWKARNVPMVVTWLETIMVLLEDIEGAWDAYTDCRQAISMCG